MQFAFIFPESFPYPLNTSSLSLNISILYLCRRRFFMSKEQMIKLHFVGGISAGFTSPARDYTGETIDLNELLIRHPSSTFLGFADGDCLNDIGIYDGDLIICDKSLDLRQGDIAVCYVDGEFTMKRVEFDVKEKVVWLMPANKNGNYKPIKVTEESDARVWGIVISSIRRLRGGTFKDVWTSRL